MLLVDVVVVVDLDHGKVRLVQFPTAARFAAVMTLIVLLLILLLLLLDLIKIALIKLLVLLPLR